MTAAELVAQIKTFVHDTTLPDAIVYQAIDNAIRDIESFGTFDYQRIEEDVVIKANTTLVPTTYDVYKVISVGNLDTTAYYVKKNKIYLTKAPTEDMAYTVIYILKSPVFDGSDANKLVPNDTVLLYGGAFYTCIFLNAPEAPVYQQLFQKELSKYYSENVYSVEADDDIAWYPNIDALGI